MSRQGMLQKIENVETDLHLKKTKQQLDNDMKQLEQKNGNLRSQPGPNESRTARMQQNGQGPR